LNIISFNSLNINDVLFEGFLTNYYFELITKAMEELSFQGKCPHTFSTNLTFFPNRLAKSTTRPRAIAYKLRLATGGGGHATNTNLAKTEFPKLNIFYSYQTAWQNRNFVFLSPVEWCTERYGGSYLLYGKRAVVNRNVTDVRLSGVIRSFRFARENEKRETFIAPVGCVILATIVPESKIRKIP